MDIRNCRNCGTIFNYVVGQVMCPACKDSLEAKFQEVKKYIEDHPGTTISEISEVCDVDAQQVKQWLRDERLEVTTESNLFLSCDGCGTSIRSGRYCDRCKYELLNGLQGAAKGLPKSPKPDDERRKAAKMRFLS